MKRIILSIIILVILFNYANANLDSKVSYNLGVVAYRKGNYDEALQKFRLIYRKNPKDFDTLYNIGNCYFQKKQYYLAVKWYMRARRLKPFDAHNLHNLALSYVKIRHFSKALKTLQTLKKIRGNETKVFYLIGSIQLYMGKFSEAIKSYHTGVQLQSESQQFEREGYKMLFYLHSLKREYTLAENYGSMIAQYYNQDAFFNFNLGYVYKNLGNFTEAMKRYKKAIKISPTFKEAYINYLYLLNVKQKWNDIVKVSENARKKFPREFYFYITAALALYRQKKYNDCLKMMKDALAINEQSVGALEFIGHLYLTKKKLKEAIKYYEKVLVHTPAKVAILVNLAYLYSRTNDLVKGVLTIHLGLHNGADKLVYRYLAQLYLKAGDANNAYQCYVNYLKKYPKGDYITFYNLAKIYENKNKWKLAFKYYKKSIKANYLFYNSHFNIALLYERRNKYSKAIAHYILCTNIYSENFEPYFRIFIIYSNNGEYNIAIEYLQKAIKGGFRNIERIKGSPKYFHLKKIAKFRRIMKKHFPNISL